MHNVAKYSFYSVFRCLMNTPRLHPNNILKAIHVQVRSCHFMRKIKQRNHTEMTLKIDIPVSTSRDHIACGWRRILLKASATPYPSSHTHWSFLPSSSVKASRQVYFSQSKRNGFWNLIGSSKPFFCFDVGGGTPNIRGVTFSLMLVQNSEQTIRASSLGKSERSIFGRECLCL